MSFADAHARRQAKEAKSYLGSSSKSIIAPPLVEAPPTPLYGALPSSVDVRTSQERGKDLYAKERFKKGKYSSSSSSHTHPRALLCRRDHPQYQATHLCIVHQKLRTVLFVLCISCSSRRSQALHTMQKRMVL